MTHCENNLCVSSQDDSESQGQSGKNQTRHLHPGDNNLNSIHFFYFFNRCFYFISTLPLRHSETTLGEGIHGQVSLRSPSVSLPHHQL